MRKHMKAADVAATMTPFLGGKPVSFRKMFPNVKKAHVSVVETDLGEEVRRQSYQSCDLPQYINCSNPLCYNGGFALGSTVEMVIRNGETSWKSEGDCQGYEGSPKGRRKDGSCSHRFDVKIQISYKKKS